MREFQKGDPMLSKNFYAGPKCFCGTVKIKTGLLSYVIHLDTGMIIWKKNTDEAVEIRDIPDIVAPQVNEDSSE